MHIKIEALAKSYNPRVHNRAQPPAIFRHFFEMAPQIRKCCAALFAGQHKVANWTYKFITATQIRQCAAIRNGHLKITILNPAIFTCGTFSLWAGTWNQHLYDNLKSWTVTSILDLRSCPWLSIYMGLFKSVQITWGVATRFRGPDSRKFTTVCAPMLAPWDSYTDSE